MNTSFDLKIGLNPMGYVLFRKTALVSVIVDDYNTL